MRALLLTFFALAAVSSFMLAVFGQLSQQQRRTDPEKPLPEPLELRVETPANVKVSLQLQADRTTVKVGQKISWSLDLINNGNFEITLVRPGDGSSDGLRTPLVQWRIKEPQPPSFHGRCGDIYALRPNEVFDLRPGERVQWEVGEPNLIGTGKFQVSFRYVNSPNWKWSERLARDGHDERAMEQVRRSTPVDIESNTVEITVVK